MKYVVNNRYPVPLDTVNLTLDHKGSYVYLRMNDKAVLILQNDGRVYTCPLMDVDIESLKKSGVEFDGIRVVVENGNN